MMAAVFAAMTLALAALYAGRRRPAVAALLVGLALGVGLFLWEIWSPATGFSMPWIQTRLDAPPAAVRG